MTCFLYPPHPLPPALNTGEVGTQGPPCAMSSGRSCPLMQWASSPAPPPLGPKDQGTVLLVTGVIS